GVMCPGWQACQLVGGTPSCQDVGVALSFVTPDAGQRFARMAMFGVVVDAGVAIPGGTPPFRAACGNATSMGTTGPISSWSVLVGAMATAGDCELVVGWEDGGPVARRNVFVDIAPPQVGLQVQPTPTRPSTWREATRWRRDERPLVLLESSEAIGAAGVQLQGMGGTPMTSTDCDNAGLPCPVGKFCQCFQVDLAGPPLPTLEGTFLLTGSATDEAGLMGVADGGVSVTRMRWQVQPAVATTHTAPAVGSDGTVYFGTQNVTMGSIYGVKPDGTPAAGPLGTGVSVGAVQSVAVARTGTMNDEYVFFSANDSTAGYVRSVKVSDGSLSGGRCEGVTGSSTYAGLALVKAGVNVHALAVINATGAMPTTQEAQLCRHTPGVGTATPAGAGTQYDLPGPGLTQPVTNLVAIPTSSTAANVFFSAAAARVWRGAVVNGNWTPGSLTAVTPDAGLPTSAALTGLAPGDSLATTLFLGGGNNASQLRRLDVATGQQAATGTGTFSPAAVASATSVWAGSEVNLARYDGSLMPVGPVAVTGGILGSPVLGNRGGVYAVSKTGGQVVLSTVAAPLPAAAGYVAGTVVASPNLDCNRLQPEAGRPGVLYFLDTAGRLTAVLVDDSKLDTTAGAWPKYQRTASNAGNPSSDFPLNPGCP
ncbi:MAG: hypothetical protein AB1938_19355, partial [Myxococcota bacterium]